MSRRRNAFLLLALLASGCHGLSRYDSRPVQLMRQVEEQPARRTVSLIEPAAARSEADDCLGDNHDVCVPELQPEAPRTEVGPSDTFSVGHDVFGFPRLLWDDTRAIANPENALILGVSLGAAIGLRQGPDQRVRAETAEHPLRWGEGSRVLGHLGEAPYQIPVLAASWGLGVWTDNPRLHEFNGALLSAYTITGLATVAIKGIANTDRPDSDWNGGHWGFPSYHAASAFSIAAVVENYCGWKAGLPAYTLAGLISWSRIDERDHDLSDVVFGAAMGYVIGKSVSDFHLGGDGHVRLAPWCHPTEGGSGVMIETRF